MAVRYHLLLSIVLLISGCATTGGSQTSAPPVSEFKCWDGSMVRDINYCPASPVTQSTCWDGSIVTDPAQCPASPVTYSCNDGSVVYDPVQCPDNTNGRMTLKTEFFSWSNPKIKTTPPAYFNAPETKEKAEVPREFFVEDGKPLPSLWDVFVKIDEALKSHSPDYSYKVYRYENGYAILTDDELIDKDGKVRLSEENTRLLPNQQNKYGAMGSLFNLFNPPEDRFRYFAFIVSTGANSSASGATTPELLEGILSQGTLPGALPKKVLAEHAFTENYWVEARVYEFPAADYLDLPKQTIAQKLQSQISNGFYTLPFANHKHSSSLLKSLFE